MPCFLQNRDLIVCSCFISDSALGIVYFLLIKRMRIYLPIFPTLSLMTANRDFCLKAASGLSIGCLYPFVSVGNTNFIKELQKVLVSNWCIDNWLVIIFIYLTEHYFITASILLYNIKTIIINKLWIGHVVYRTYNLSRITKFVLIWRQFGECVWLS